MIQTTHKEEAVQRRLSAISKQLQRYINNYDELVAEQGQVVVDTEIEKLRNELEQYKSKNVPVLNDEYDLLEHPESSRISPHYGHGGVYKADLSPGNIRTLGVG